MIPTHKAQPGDTFEAVYSRTVAALHPIAFMVSRNPIDTSVVAEYIETQFEDYCIAQINLSAVSFGVPVDIPVYAIAIYRSSIGPFNVRPPTLPEFKPAVYDAIWNMRDRTTRPIHPKSEIYDADCFYDLSAEDWHDIEFIPQGENLKSTAEYRLFKLCKQRVEDETGKMFLQSPRRISWCNTLPIIGNRRLPLLHPKLHRPLTLGELAACYGLAWPCVSGPAPIAQIRDSIPQVVCDWLQDQAALFLGREWGTQNYESRFDRKAKRWIGRNCDPDQKVKRFDLTEYTCQNFTLARFPPEIFAPFAKSDACPETGRIWNPWKETK